MRRTMLQLAKSATSVIAIASLHLYTCSLNSASTAPPLSLTCSQPTASSWQATPRTLESEPMRSSMGPCKSSRTSPACNCCTTALAASVPSRRAVGCEHQRCGWLARSKKAVPPALPTVTHPQTPSRTRRQRMRCKPKPSSVFVAPIASSRSPGASLQTRFADWISKISVRTMSRTTRRKSAKAAEKRFCVSPCNAIRLKAALPCSGDKGGVAWVTNSQNCAALMSEPPLESRLNNSTASYVSSSFLAAIRNASSAACSASEAIFSKRAARRSEAARPLRSSALHRSCNRANSALDSKTSCSPKPFDNSRCAAAI
mmetsp:Transcript_13655/g.39342  ORF Transcript_13655/g.39342 Transcript_13655/m.39342 type:complete len:315 (-) Transcript_13655:2121-3065(-)